MKISKHWIVMIWMCGLSAAAVGICANCMGVFYSPLATALGVGRGTLTLGITISSIVSACVNLFVLKWMKNDNFRKWMFLGIVLCSGATMLMSIINHVISFYLLNIVRGFGLSLFGAVVYTTIINNWFNKNHGLATSIVMGFTGIAGALGTPVFNSLIRNQGWRYSFIIMGIVIFVITIPAVIYNYSFAPGYENLLPYGNEKRKVIQIHDQSEFNYGSITFISVVLFSLLMCLITGISQHFPGFSESIHLGSGVGAYMISLCMIGNVTSKLLIGSLSDKIGWYKSILMMMVVVIISAVILLISSNALMCYIGSLLLGAIYSIAAVGIVLITKNIFGTNNYHKAYPMISFITSMGGAWATSLIGFTYDFTGSYRLVFLFVIIISLISFILLAIANRTKEQN